MSGKFLITAEYKDLRSNSCKLKVNKKFISLQAQNVEADVKDSEAKRQLVAPVFKELCDQDKDIVLENGVDYIQKSSGVTAKEPGDYEIKLAWLKNADTREYSETVKWLLLKYDIDLVDANYKLTDHKEEKGTLQLDMPDVTLYGSSVSMNAVFDDGETSKDVTKESTYEVRYYNDLQNAYLAASQEMYEISDGKFSPKAAGKFEIISSYEDIKSNSCKIRVNRKDAQFTAQDKKVTLASSKEERALEKPVLSGLYEYDQDLVLTEGVDYKQSCSGLDSDELKDYDIKISWIKDSLTGEYSETVSKLLQNYNVELVNGTYHIGGITYAVASSVLPDSKGSVTILAQIPTEFRAKMVPSGISLPMNSYVKWVAKADSGYVVDRWIRVYPDKLEEVVDEKTGKLYQEDELEVEYLDDNYQYRPIFKKAEILVELPEKTSYGNSAALSIYKKKTGEQISITDPDLQIAVSYMNGDGEYVPAEEGSQYEMIEGAFIAKQALPFRLAVTYQNYERNTVDITIAKREAQFSAQDITALTNDSAEKRVLKAPVWTGLAKWDKETIKLTEGKDYFQESKGTSAASAGSYEIKLKLSEDSIKVKSLLKNYLITVADGKYTLKNPPVISYTLKIQQPTYGSILVKDAKGKAYASGSKIPQGTKLTATVTPKAGYGLKEWTKGLTGNKKVMTFVMSKNITLAVSLEKCVGLNYGLSVTGTCPISIKWGAVKYVDGYDVFLLKCDKASQFDTAKPVKSLTASQTSLSLDSLNKTKLNKVASYKLQIRAYQKINGKKVYVESSPELHRVGTSKTFTNSKDVKLSSTRISMTVGSSKTIQPVAVKTVAGRKLLGTDHGKPWYYYSTNTKVATVKEGKITATGKGTCQIHVISLNGSSKAITIVVK